MLRSVQNERWNVSGALAELLDNSFGPGRGNGVMMLQTNKKTQKEIFF
jgi:hypothetical protein